MIYFAQKSIIMNVFYYLSSCDTCKRILKTLDLPANVALIDIKKYPLSQSQLDELFQHTNSYEALLNKRAQKLKEINKDELNEETIKNLLSRHYTFLKRPVLCYNNQLFIGNAKATIEAAKEALNE